MRTRLVQHAKILTLMIPLLQSHGATGKKDKAVWCPEEFRARIIAALEDDVVPPSVILCRYAERHCSSVVGEAVLRIQDRYEQMMASLRAGSHASASVDFTQLFKWGEVCSHSAASSPIAAARGIGLLQHHLLELPEADKEVLPCHPPISTATISQQKKEPNIFPSTRRNHHRVHTPTPPTANKQRGGYPR